MTFELIREALKTYGGDLNEVNEIISPRGKETGITLIKKGKRLRMESSLQLVSSGPFNPSTICSFVEKYWFWEKRS